MKTYKDEGIIFKQNELGETDKIVSILTKYHGRVNAVAKGIRKMTSRKAGSVDLGYHSKFAFAKGKNLDIITEAELINSYPEFKSDIKLSFWLFFVCEIIDNFVKDGEKQTEIFALTILLFDLLQTIQNPLAMYSYVLKILQLGGFDPNLKTCQKCGNILEEGDENYNSLNDLGFLCKSDKYNNSSKISDRAIKTIRFLRDEELEKTVNVKATDQLINEVSSIITNWTEIVLDKELKSKKYMII